MFHNKVDIRIFWNFFETNYNISVSVNTHRQNHRNAYFKFMRLSMSASDQKLYTEFWLSPLWFCLWLDGINSRFKSHLDNKSKERFYNQRARESKCRKTKTVDKGILITYRFSDRKFSQHIITPSDLPKEKGIRNNSVSSLFHKLLKNVMRMKSFKTVSWNGTHRSLLHLPWPHHFC